MVLLIQWFTLIPHSPVLWHMTGLSPVHENTLAPHWLTDKGQFHSHLSAMPWVSFTSSSSQPLKVDVPKDSIFRFIAGQYLLLIIALSSLSGQMSHNSITITKFRTQRKILSQNLSLGPGFSTVGWIPRFFIKILNLAHPKVISFPFCSKTSSYSWLPTSTDVSY